MSSHQKKKKGSILLLVFGAAVFATSHLHADCSLRLEELGELKSLIKRQTYLKEAVKECAEDYQINYFYGYNLERLRKYDESLRFYEKAVRLNPQFSKSYFALGDVYLVQGRYEASIASFKKGLELDPDNIWAKRSLKKARKLFQEKPPVREEVPQVLQLTESSSVTASFSHALIPPNNKAASTLKEEVDQSAFHVISADSFIQHMTVAEDKAEGKSNPVLQMQIQFLRSSDKLTEEAMTELEKVVCTALQSEALVDSRFEVAGHTDNSGDFELNMYLSKMRARSVKDFLEKNCQIEPGRLSVVYYGETRPAFPNTSLKNRKLNRRVEFRRLD